MKDQEALEELFRKEAMESMGQEKPREIVWQKIENNLQDKRKSPLKEFIQSVWFSAAVFALIAIPYFYFFIENMNLQEQNSNFVKTTIQEIITPDNEEVNLPSLDSIEKNEKPQIVVNQPKFEDSKVKVYPQLPLPNESDEDHNQIQLETTSSKIDTSIVTVRMASEIGTSKLKDTEPKRNDTLLLAATRGVQMEENAVPSAAKTFKAQVSPAPTSTKEIEPILIYRNRFVVQDQVNRVGFNFVKSTGNRVIFEKGGVRVTFIRDKGMVKVLSNSKNINSNVLALLHKHKERIFNYYVNFKKATTENGN